MNLSQQPSVWWDVLDPVPTLAANLLPSAAPQTGKSGAELHWVFFACLFY